MPFWHSTVGNRVSRTGLPIFLRDQHQALSQGQQDLLVPIFSSMKQDNSGQARPCRRQDLPHQFRSKRHKHRAIWVVLSQLEAIHQALDQEGEAEDSVLLPSAGRRQIEEEEAAPLVIAFEAVHRASHRDPLSQYKQKRLRVQLLSQQYHMLSSRPRKRKSSRPEARRSRM